MRAEREKQERRRRWSIVFLLLGLGALCGLAALGMAIHLEVTASPATLPIVAGPGIIVDYQVDQIVITANDSDSSSTTSPAPAPSSSIEFADYVIGNPNSFATLSPIIFEYTDSFVSTPAFTYNPNTGLTLTNVQGFFQVTYTLLDTTRQNNTYLVIGINPNDNLQYILFNSYTNDASSTHVAMAVFPFDIPGWYFFLASYINTFTPVTTSMLSPPWPGNYLLFSGITVSNSIRIEYLGPMGTKK